MADYRQLAVWKKAHALTLELYRQTEAFPKAELFGLTSQIRRAAASVGANLAEGCGRRGDTEFHRFITIAIGSCDELDYHLLLARDLGYIDREPYEQAREQIAEVGRMLSGLQKQLNKRKERIVRVAP
jgi:four helix bundle protein